MKVIVVLMVGSVLSALLATGAHARTGVQVPASAWEIGPIRNGRSYSHGPIRPLALGGALGVPIGAGAEPHYVTFRHGSLQGKTQIRMRFRVEGPPGVTIYGAKCPVASPSAVTLYFQHGADNWRTDGGRWWATFASVSLTGPMGETEIVAPLDANWTSVMRMSARTNPGEFAAAKINADRVGFTFANCEGFGHGARATAPVRFVVTSFQVL